MSKMRWDAIISRLPFNKDIIGVEIGVWNGKCSLQLLKSYPFLYLYMVDQWKADDQDYINSGDSKAPLTQKDFNNAMYEAIDITKDFDYRRTVMPVTSEIAAKAFESINPFFVFIDGNHAYEYVKKDIELWYPKIADGGFICGHDYGVYNGVKKAVDEIFSKDKIELDSDWTWFVGK